jgi:hypothetical protein
VSSVNSVEEPYTSDTRQSFDLASGPGRSVTMTIAIECDLMVADSSGRVIKNHGVFSQGTHRVELPSTSNCYIFSDTRGALKSAVICK